SIKNIFIPTNKLGCRGENSMLENNGQIAKQRQDECGKHVIWLERRIGQLSGLNWLTVLVPSLLAVAAGSALFAGDKWGPFVAGAALFAAILSAIHKGLNCDTYQADCRRLLKAYRALSVSYRTLSELEPNDRESRLLELEAQLESLSQTDCITKMKPNHALNADA
ncbi:MAG: hypothetical protein R8K20_02455, partial [Gallionellaceae bacterium]